MASHDPTVLGASSCFGSNRLGSRRQAYMRLSLEDVTVDLDSIRLEGSPVILEKLASRGLSKSSPEVLSSVREWRPREDSNLRPPV